MSGRIHVNSYDNSEHVTKIAMLRWDTDSLSWVKFSGDAGGIAADVTVTNFPSVQPVNDNGSSLTIDTLQLPANLGQTTSAGSVSVVLASNHPDINIRITDGSATADVLDLSNSNPLAVAIVDSNGDQITSFGGGVQYEEGTTDATITGTAIMWEDSGDTLRPVSVSSRLPVSIPTTTSVHLTDGTDGADIFGLSNSGALAVAIVDGAGDQITSFGGGVQYDEGATDATITGTAIMWEDSGDTLRPVSAGSPLPINIVAATSSGVPIRSATTTGVVVAPNTTTGFPVVAATATGLAVSAATTTGIIVAPNTSSGFQVVAATATGLAVSAATTTGVVVSPNTTSGYQVVSATTTGVIVVGNTSTGLVVNANTSTGLIVTGNTSTGLIVNANTTTGLVVDTELVAAAALADGQANPTTSRVGSALMVMNALGTWNRVREMPGSDNQSVTGIMGTGLLGFDGSTYDRIRGNSTDGLDVRVTSMARTATTITTQVIVSVATASAAVLAANSSRKKAFIQNHGADFLRLSLGVTATATSIIRIPPAVGAYPVEPDASGAIYTGAINGVSEGATISVGVIEET